jgi:hypothetical protein
VLSRDQILHLRYFGSATRANTRLRALVKLQLIKRYETAFYSQGLYIPGPSASEVTGERIARIIGGRSGSPRFLQHALSVTNVRIALSRKSEGQWRYEQQLWRSCEETPRFEVRPDGLFLASTPIFVEVDLGHVAPAKFAEKLRFYARLSESGNCASLYGFPAFRLLTVTTGSLRARHLRRLLPREAAFELLVQTFEEVGAAPISSWS